MDAKLNQKGQSVLEFLFLMPLVVIFIGLLIRIMIVTQTSIVQQKYARAQALTLTGYSPEFPSTILRQSAYELHMNQMLIGIAKNNAPAEDADYPPRPPIVAVSRPGTDMGQTNPNPSSLRRRGRVRVRTSVTLCSQLNAIPSGGQWMRYEDAINPAKASGQPGWAYCKGVEVQ